MKTLFITLLLFLTSPLMAKPYVIQADGLMCQACIETVTDGFQKIDESASVSVNLENQTITVDIDDLSEDSARKIITDRGYQFISMSY